MATYLLVAYQTAQSSPLLAAAQELSREDPSAEFVLLVPATPVSSLLVKEQGDSGEIARRRAAAARDWLQDAGVRMADAKVGDADPRQAIDEELDRGQPYAGIVISTLPQGVSQWLRQDLVSQVRRRFPGIRVEHVTSELPAPSSG
jgi:hypothetical protein